MMDFSARVSKQFRNLTYSQKNIANYILDHMNQIPYSTLEDLADKVGVSTTTVIRFAQMFGYSGYSEMQKDIQSASGIRKSSLPDRNINLGDASADRLLMDSFQNDIRNIQETLAAQNAADLARVVDLISDARTIYILGMRSSYSSAYYLASRLGEIRKNVRFIQSCGMMFPEEIVGAGEGDVLVAYLFPRYSRIAATMTAWMKEHGVKIVLITSMNDTPIRTYGDVILPCSTNSISYKNSFSAPMSLTNYLVLAISRRDPEEALDTLQKTENILEQGYYLGP